MLLAYSTDTIVAIATPPGMGGIGIIRISGPLATLATTHLLGTKKPLIPNQAVYTDFLATSGKILDRGIAIFFKAPHSFTGEDVLELQAHGSPVMLTLLLRNIQTLGIRIAEPGEFSKRAFLNNKIDLLQAESIGYLIQAQTIEAALAASKTLQGAFSRHINQILDYLINLRMQVEAVIDFPEEDLDPSLLQDLEVRINTLEQKLFTLLEQAIKGNIINHGIKAIIIGDTNVGKSSLLNQLLQEERIIVSNIPGTTRDLISYKINLEGLIIDFIDTAGIRFTTDVVENIGIQKAIAEIAKSDLIILMKSVAELPKETNLESIKILNISNFLPSIINTKDLGNKKLILLLNKIDLYNIPAQHITSQDQIDLILISALHGNGIELLYDAIKKNLKFSTNEASPFIATARHITTLEAVVQHISLSKNIFTNANNSLTTLDLIAEELQLAQKHLSSITGAFNNEDLLNKIFAEFCLGK